MRAVSDAVADDVCCRKYLRVATDHEEVLAFLLGQLVKDKVRYQTLRDSTSPASVTIRISELEERVRRRLFVFCSLSLQLTIQSDQAKELEIYDINAFTVSVLFKTNGYKKTGNNIVKSFSDEL